MLFQAFPYFPDNQPEMYSTLQERFPVTVLCKLVRTVTTASYAVVVYH